MTVDRADFFIGLLVDLSPNVESLLHLTQPDKPLLIERYRELSKRQKLAGASGIFYLYRTIPPFFPQNYEKTHASAAPLLATASGYTSPAPANLHHLGRPTYRKNLFLLVFIGKNECFFAVGRRRQAKAPKPELGIANRLAGAMRILVTQDW